MLVGLLAGAASVGPAMSDSKALFHADHGNLATPAGAAISDGTLGAARLALRIMKGLDGVSVVPVTPKFLVVPAAIEGMAEKYLATLYPAAASNANPFSGGKLELVVEPRLDGKSAARWYVFGDPYAGAPVLEYSYLDGAQGPTVDSQPGWEVLGMDYRAYLDFGAGAVEFRGACCNPGQ